MSKSRSQAGRLSLVGKVSSSASGVGQVGCSARGVRKKIRLFDILSSSERCIK